jgi:hypothetical protein
MSSQAQVRHQKLKQFVEEALGAGVFYERDMKERILPQMAAAIGPAVISERTVRSSRKSPTTAPSGRLVDSPSA